MAIVDTRWFQTQLAEKKMSQRKLARHIGLDPSAVSLMLRGKRDIKLEEASELARILGLPLDDVIAHAGIDLPRESGMDTVPVKGWLDDDMTLHPQQADGPAHAPKPPGVPDGTVATRIMFDGYQDGWLVYYVPVDYVMPEALGRLSIVEDAKTGRQTLRVLKHGYEQGLYRLSHPMSGKTESARISSAAAVIWMRP